LRILILINDAPYGSEKAYNGLRLAIALQKDHPTVEVWVFLMADAVGCALPGQSTAQGYYNIERMVKSVLTKGGKVKTCGTCIDARGLAKLPLIDGVERSTMAELAQWTVEADNVFTF
jgi:uncharacterized protein involved in oxidation of intracellular sulfur